MRGQVLGSTIRLGLDDSADALQLAIGMHQMHANELAGDLQCAACVKVTC
jgi:hypothetical protein